MHRKNSICFSTNPYFSSTNRTSPVWHTFGEFALSSYPASTATMMNFRVAPILPMSFGSHGDLPVLTKRTIWYLQSLRSPLHAPFEKQADPSSSMGRLLWVAQLPIFILRARHSMMSNTSTIKCRSIMTSKLVRLPDMTSWSRRFCIQRPFLDKWLTGILAGLCRMIYCGINGANRYVEDGFTFVLLMM